MISAERPRKRPRSNSNYSNSAIKRTIIARTLAPSWSEEQDFISKANSIHPVPTEDVPIASSQSSPFALPGSSFYLLTQQPEQNPRPPLPVLWNLTPEHYAQPSTAGCEQLLTNGLSPATTMYGHASLCFPDKVFGFARPTHQWADCLAGFVPFRPGSTNQPDLAANEYRYPPENFDNGISAPEKSCIASSGTNPYGFVPYSDSPPNRMLGPVVAEMQDSQFFACDDIASIPSWQSSYPVLQPVPVETRQPLNNPQNMTYRMAMIDQVECLGSHNSHINLHADRCRLAIQTYDSNGAGPISTGEYAEDLESADRALARREFGPSRRGPFRRLEDRLQTAQTRKSKACLRCRMQKIRCIPDPADPLGVCVTCQKVTSPKVSSLECLRYKITQIRLFKPGQVPGLDWTDRWLDAKLTDISKWKSPSTRRILTTEGFSSSPLALEVREFVPQEGDVLERHWYIPGGIRKSVKVPCFAIADVNTAKMAYVDYINRGGAEFFEGWLQNKDELVRMTYSAAIEAANNSNTSVEERDLLKKVLRLWVAIRITTRSIRIRGEDTLGMRPDILDETSPLHGEIPIPPVMGAQIELILIQGIQIPLRKAVLDKLQDLIKENKPSTWFTRYLCLFILLHNCAMITKYDIGYAKKYIPERTYARPRTVEEYHTGANVLLAYWHYCNKGSQPFAPGSSAADFHAMSELDPHQTAFVRDTSNRVQANEKSWKLLQQTHDYGHDYFFASQLFEPDWKPRFSTII